MDPVTAFKNEVKENIEGLVKADDLKESSMAWMRSVANHKYTYNFTWMGRPIIQFPQDMIALQEII